MTTEWQRSPSYHHRAITLALILINLLAILYALHAGGPGQRDFHFRQVSFITWLASAQMLGAALLFLACYFAGKLIRLEGEASRDNHTWLVFALGFFVLAVDQQFLLREQVTAWIERVPVEQLQPGGTSAFLKLAVATVAVTLVIYYRATVLANFAMVVAFTGGFWFLLVTLLGNMLVESIGLEPWLGKVLQGSGKLLAMALFLSGSYIVLLDRLRAAHLATQLALYGDRRRRQLPITFPDRRGRVEFRPLADTLAAAAAEARVGSSQRGPAVEGEAEPVAEPPAPLLAESPAPVLADPSEATSAPAGEEPAVEGSEKS